MSKLQIKLLKDKPHKIYSAKIEIDYHIEELSKFLTNHKDKILEVVINGKTHKFTSVASRKKFSAGFREAGKIAFTHVKSFTKKSQGNINKLTNELTQLKQEKQSLKDNAVELRGKYNTQRVVVKLRYEAWQDHTQELTEACELLKGRLDRIEPIISKIKKAKSEGDLNAIHIKVKKEKI